MPTDRTIMNITPSSSSGSTRLDSNIDLDAAYATALQAASHSAHIPDEEARKNPFMLSEQGQRDLEAAKQRAQEEGRGGIVSPLEIKEVREKYEQVLGYMEKAQEVERTSREASKPSTEGN